MYIEEIVLEGFKSYGKRTVISGWDPEFNSITGPNGSGKSNVLDAICFVLGLDNLKQIRAGTLQDLIYKRGQTGVTKASVSIVFDNRDPKTSPVGFREIGQIVVTRQVVMGGKSKYMINGTNAMPSRVEMLFKSVQLNIENPHFLIMQGKITRILNFKPRELALMIEEVAGTRTYEDRKAKAKATLVKKEQKIVEIQESIGAIISPRLEQLKRERQAVFEHRKMVAEYLYHEKHLLQNEQVEMQLKLENVEHQLRQGTAGREQHLDQCQALEQQLREQDLDRQGQATLAGLQDRLQSVGNDLSGLCAKRQVLAGVLQDETNEMAGLQVRLEEFKQHSTLEVSAAQEMLEQKKRELAENQNLYNGLCTGISGTGGCVGYEKLVQEERGQLARNQKALEWTRRELEQAENLVQREAKQAEEWKQAVASKQARLGRERDELEQVKKTIEGKRLQHGDIGSLRDQKQRLEQELNRIDAEIRSTAISFERDRNFSLQQVKGLLGTLIRVKQEYLEWKKALEQCAGNKLYHVVVVDEQVGRAVLEARNKRRITVIPLNKIQRPNFDQRKLEMAQERGSVYLAKDLIEFEDEVLPAVEYVFGNTLLCRDRSLGMWIAFDHSMQVKCITVDGDVYDPKGTMSGGRGAEGSGSFEVFEKTSLLLDSKQRTTEELEQVCRHIEDYKQHQILADQLQTKHQLVEQMEKALSEDAICIRYHQYMDRISQMNDLAQQVDETNKLVLKSIELIRGYEHDSAQYAQNKEGKLEEIRNRLAELKQQIDQDHMGIEAAKHESRILAQTRSDIETRMEAIELQIQNGQAKVQKLDLAIQEFKDIETQICGEIQKIAPKKPSEDFVMARTRLMEEFRMAQSRMKHQESQNCQLEELKQQLGIKLGTIRDKLDRNMLKGHPAELQIEPNRERYLELGSRLQDECSIEEDRFVECIESLEKKKRMLEKQLEKIKSDRIKISNTCGRLDVYRIDMLNTTFAQVNQHFGDIFSQLLPGSWAGLVKDDAGDMHIQVQLGTMCPKTLAELSGGQRSLVALSLVLATLKFRPAPFYILDEIDAALDTSHTQNIGQVFRSQFKESQFVVVSLKQGLFEHANVVFRTRFLNGTSSVDREPKYVI